MLTSWWGPKSTASKMPGKNRCVGKGCSYAGAFGRCLVIKTMNVVSLTLTWIPSIQSHRLRSYRFDRGEWILTPHVMNQAWMRQAHLSQGCQQRCLDLKSDHTSEVAETTTAVQHQTCRVPCLTGLSPPLQQPF